MTFWEKTAFNLQKGVQKIGVAAAMFSERVKAELGIVRLRMNVDEIQGRISELYRIIGRRLVDLKERDALPKAGEQLLKDEEIAAALSELVTREKEIDELNAEIESMQAAFTSAEKKSEDVSA